VTSQRVPTADRVLTREPDRARRLGRLATLWDLCCGLGVFAIYLLVALSVERRTGAADRSARAVDGAERWLHLPTEAAINRWTATHRPIAEIANYHYAIGYLATTLACVFWLRFAHRPNYARHVLALLGINVVAIAVFCLCPTTPPRLLGGAGFVDTVEQHGTVGSWGSGVVAATANQHAAMPSLHVAWATWVALTLLYQRVPFWLSRGGLLHIGTTTAVIVMTGNHWWLDAAAGAALAVTVDTGLRVLFRHRLEPPAPMRRTRLAMAVPREPAD
jgi:diacylglycerol O-acyltransferase / wax synthase